MVLGDEEGVPMMLTLLLPFTAAWRSEAMVVLEEAEVVDLLATMRSLLQQIWTPEVVGEAGVAGEEVFQGAEAVLYRCSRLKFPGHDVG